MKLRVGMVGCGNIAKIHLLYVLRSVGAENIAICDKDEFRLDEFSQKEAIDNKYNDLEKMISQFHPDVVHVLTPPSTHKDVAIKCLQGGCHVLIEKPMCLTTGEADEIIKVAQKKNLLVCVDHTRLFDPQVIKAKEILNSGSLGKIVNISVEYSHDFLDRTQTDSTSRWIRNLPGGIFFDILPHPLCLLEEFLPNLKLEKSVDWKNSENIMTDVWCIFSSDSGSGSLHMSLNIFPLKNHVIFECTKGSLIIDFRNFLFLERKRYGLPNAVERVFGNFSVGFQTFKGTLNGIFNFIRGRLDSYSGLDRIIQEFYLGIIKNGESPVPPEKARQLLLLVERIFPDRLGKEEHVKSHKERPLKEADVLVTGGTGFIGKRLVSKLLERGYKVRILTHRDISDKELKSLYHNNCKAEIVCGDVFNYQDVERASIGVNTIYHLAAATKGDWNYHIDTTITGTKNVLAAASKVGAKHVVYVSTLNVYNGKEYPQNGFIKEDFPYEDRPEKRGFYSNAKLKAEKIVNEFGQENKMSISILRPGLVYGPGGRILPQDVGYRIGKKLVVVLGNGKKRIPLIYVGNVVEALLLAGEKKGKAKGVFNVVDNDYPTQLQYLKMYKNISGESFLTICVPTWIVFSGFWLVEKVLAVFFKKSPSFVYRLRSIKKNVRYSTERIKNTLGWEQKVFFEEGLKMTLQTNIKTGRII